MVRRRARNRHRTNLSTQRHPPSHSPSPTSATPTPITATLSDEASRRLMPQIPGMWYDASRNRYFRCTRDFRQPRPAPPPSPFPLPRPSANTILRSAELGRDLIDVHRLPSSLLSLSKPTLIDQNRPLRPGYCHIEVQNAIAVAYRRNEVRLFSFPHGHCLALWSMPHTAEIIAVDYHEATQCYGVILYDQTRGRHQTHLQSDYASYTAQLSPAFRNMQRGATLELRGAAHAISIGPNVAAIAAKHCTYYTPSLADMTWESLPHPDQSDGLAVYCNDETAICTGTRAGNVYVFDTRAPQQGPTWIGMSSTRRSVADLKLSEDKHTIFISRMRNGKDNLAAWDLRMSGKSQKPLFSFTGHVNSHKLLRFDISEHVPGGLLLAGSDDSCIRAWNASTGGLPSSVATIPGELPKVVKLVYWRSGPSSQRPGAWIVSDEQAYTLQIGPGSSIAEASSL